MRPDAALRCDRGERQSFAVSLVASIQSGHVREFFEERALRKNEKALLAKFAPRGDPKFPAPRYLGRSPNWGLAGWMIDTLIRYDLTNRGLAFSDAPQAGGHSSELDAMLAASGAYLSAREHPAAMALLEIAGEKLGAKPSADSPAAISAAFALALAEGPYRRGAWEMTFACHLPNPRGLPLERVTRQAGLSCTEDEARDALNRCWQLIDGKALFADAGAIMAGWISAWTGSLHPLAHFSRFTYDWNLPLAALVGGANPDLVASVADRRALLDVKTIKDGANLAALWQLAGYVLLNGSDPARSFDDVGIYYARHGQLITVPVQEFFQLMFGDVDLVRLTGILRDHVSA